MAGFKFKELFKIEKKPRKGLIKMEWAVLVYMLFTLLLMLVMSGRLHSVGPMMVFRFRVLFLMAIMWGIYRLVPCPLVMYIRVAVQMVMLADWYPDTYEFNRCFDNLDYLFCGFEQNIFHCQPSLLFSKILPWGIISEPMCFGYVMYYPIIIFTATFYFLYRRQYFERTAFIIMVSFFLFYVIFIFIPVAGPTFYYQAVGIEQIEQCHFPDIGNYFENHSSLKNDCLATPGWQGGLFWNLVEMAKWAGERPTAAFPSSHVGVTTVCMWLLWKTNNRRVFWWVMIPAVLMFFATFYIQAHYLIDAIAGLLVGTMFYFLPAWIYDKLK